MSLQKLSGDLVTAGTTLFLLSHSSNKEQIKLMLENLVQQILQEIENE